MSLTTFAPLADLTLGLYLDFSWSSSLVETAIDWIGLVTIFAYPFLIAFALPGVSEIVLAAPLDLSLSHGVKLAIITLVDGTGEAAGSVFAFRIGRQTRGSGYVERTLKRLPVDVMDWTERKTVRIVQNWGFAGFAAALCVSGFPDTLSIYAFLVLKDNYLKFAAAMFIGSYGRLVMTVIGIEAALALL